MAHYQEDVTTDIKCLHDYGSVLFTVCDMFGRPRGRFAVGKGIHKFSEHGIEIPHTTCMLGFHSELPLMLSHCNRESAMMCKMFPDLSTLRPLSWLCTKDKKVGHVLCDLLDAEGLNNVSSTRAIALKQIDELENLGYRIMSSFETEFIVFQQGTLKPYGDEHNEYANLMALDTHMTFYYSLMTSLLVCGVPVETQMKESAPGQIEYSMRPQFGINTADSVHRLRYITKCICEKNGLEASFMARHRSGMGNSGFHLNHSLWTMNGKNAFYDPNGDHSCSDTLYHWVAGLIHHGHALTALMNPTVNCYERLHRHFTPSDNIWNYNDKNARLRVKTKGTNIHIEERLPSAACNPYLSLAGLLAAGMDGIVRKLQISQPRIYRPNISGDERATVKNQLPKSLDEALEALQKDHILTKAIGEDFVQHYVALCKKFQLEKLKNVIGREPDERFQAQRDLYLHTL